MSKLKWSKEDAIFTGQEMVNRKIITHVINKDKSFMDCASLYFFSVCCTRSSILSPTLSFQLVLLFSLLIFTHFALSLSLSLLFFFFFFTCSLVLSFIRRRLGSGFKNRLKNNKRKNKLHHMPNLLNNQKEKKKKWKEQRKKETTQTLLTHQTQQPLPQALHSLLL
jgi:ABC-type multidrug transport system fused ATPase/permease subunit